MPRPTHELSPFVYSELRKHIRIKTGLLIQTKPECERLALLIKEQTNNLISTSTLYRIFISEENTKPYLNTLNALSLFCGFKDWYEFEHYVNEQARFDFSYGKIHINEKPVSSFIRICIHNNQLEILHKYAAQFPNDIEFDKKIRIGYEFYLSLLDNPNSNIVFFEQFSSLPIIREAFFEYMADPDFKIKDYEYGLLCYLKYCTPPKNLTDYRDIIFAKSLLFRHYYLSADKQKANKIGQELYQNGLTDLFDLESLYIFPKLRYLAYRLLYKKMFAEPDTVHTYRQFLLDYAQANLSSWSVFEQSVVLYNLAEVFVMTYTEKTINDKLKSIFQDLITKLPKSLQNKPLYKILPHFEGNAIKQLKFLKIEY